MDFSGFFAHSDGVFFDCFGVSALLIPLVNSGKVAAIDTTLVKWAISCSGGGAGGELCHFPLWRRRGHDLSQL